MWTKDAESIFFSFATKCNNMYHKSKRKIKNKKRQCDEI